MEYGNSNISNGIRELYPDSYEDRRLEMERKEEVYSKNLEKRRLKKWKNLTESNSTFSKEIKEVELNKNKNVIHNNTSIQRNSHEDSLSVEESTNKASFITDNRILRRKKKKTYAEVVESGNSNINERKKCGKNCTILTGNKQDALGRKDAFEAASKPIQTCNKPLLNQNVPQCVDILNKTVVDPLLEKELLVASKDSNIRVIDKTSSQVGKSFVDFEAIKRDLLSGENSSKTSNNPPVVCTNTSVVQKNYDVNTSSDIRLSSTQDMELLEILEELQNSNEIISSDSSCDVIPDKRLKGYFCSDTVFNLSGRVLSESEIKVLEKGLEFAPFQRKVNEPELRRDFQEFCRRMRIKWHFRNEISEDFSEVPAFSPKSSWNPPQGHPNLEVYLSQVENELFSIADEPIRYSNLSKEEWIAMRSLADDRSIVIKKADKGSCIVVWDRNDYLTEAEKQLEDPNVYRKFAFKDKTLSQLVDFSNKFFKNLKMKGHITEKELKYFSYEFKKSCNLGKLYLLPKIRKSCENVPGRPVISNCGTPTEKVSEFFDRHLKQ